LAAWNRFSYVHNSPTNYVDPSGHNPLVVLALVAGVGGLVGGAAYFSQHPFDPAYILEHPSAPQALEFYKAVVGRELLAVSFLIPFSPMAMPGQIRWAIVGAHVTTYGSDIAQNAYTAYLNRDFGPHVFLPRSSWQTYLGNAVGATIAGSMQWGWNTSAFANAAFGGAARRMTINWFETGQVNWFEVGADAFISGVTGQITDWGFNYLGKHVNWLQWLRAGEGLDFTKPPLGQKTFELKDVADETIGLGVGHLLRDPFIKRIRGMGP
jgi:hypothetical protein